MLKLIASCCAVLAFCSFGYAQVSSRFAAAGIDDETQVQTFFAEFQKAVAADDQQAVAALVEFPVRASLPIGKNGRRALRSIENKTAFLKSYDKIFTADFKRLVANAKFEELWARDTGVATANGEVWMSAICKNKSCKDSAIRIITLHGLTAATAKK